MSVMTQTATVDSPRTQTRSKVYRLPDIAAMGEMSLRTAQRMSDAGIIPGRIELSPRMIRHDRAKVDAWFSAGCPRPR
jgi:predicted DNA-binding transcriptional regulator AlpA